MNREKRQSLRRQLIVRMLAMMLPLFILLWAIAYFSSQYFINAAFDRSLMRRTFALADRVEVLLDGTGGLPVARANCWCSTRSLLFHCITSPMDGSSR